MAKAMKQASVAKSKRMGREFAEELWSSLAGRNATELMKGDFPDFLAKRQAKREACESGAFCSAAERMFGKLQREWLKYDYVDG